MTWGIRTEDTKNENITNDTEILDVNGNSVEEKKELSTKLYVICQDDKPLFYIKDYKEAQRVLWECARKERSRNMDMNTYVSESFDRDLILVTGNYRFLFTIYSRLLSRFTITTVKSYDSVKDEYETDDESNCDDDESDEETGEDTGDETEEETGDETDKQ